MQIDETAFAKFGDPDVQATLSARGDNWSELIDRYIAVTNRVTARRAEDDAYRHAGICAAAIAAGTGMLKAVMRDVAERLFNALEIPFFFLEYDTPRAGNFTPLRFVPRHKSIVLGLVSSKTPALEGKAALRARVEEASRHVTLDRLAVSPQCGFASVETGNPVTPQAQEAKLRHVVELARDIWGEA